MEAFLELFFFWRGRGSQQLPRRIHFMWDLIFGKRKKLQGWRSGEYVSCWSWGMLYFAKDCCTRYCHELNLHTEYHTLHTLLPNIAIMNGSYWERHNLICIRDKVQGLSVPSTFTLFTLASLTQRQTRYFFIRPRMFTSSSFSGRGNCTDPHKSLSLVFTIVHCIRYVYRLLSCVFTYFMVVCHRVHVFVLITERRC